jgi:hypothetical protein
MDKKFSFEPHVAWLTFVAALVSLRVAGLSNSNKNISSSLVNFVSFFEAAL